MKKVTTTSGDLTVTIGDNEYTYPIDISIRNGGGIKLTRSEAKLLYVVLDNYLNHTESSNPPPDEL